MVCISLPYARAYDATQSFIRSAAKIFKRQIREKRLYIKEQYTLPANCPLISLLLFFAMRLLNKDLTCQTKRVKEIYSLFEIKPLIIQFSSFFRLIFFSVFIWIILIEELKFNLWMIFNWYEIELETFFLLLLHFFSWLYKQFFKWFIIYCGFFL